MDEKDIQVLKTAVSDAMKPVADSVKDLGTKVTTIETATADLKTRLEKIERTPIVDKNINVNTKTSERFMGYRISKQFARFRGQAKDNPDFEKINSDEEIDKYSKFMIALLKASKDHDQEAKQYLNDFYKEYVAEILADNPALAIAKTSLYGGSGTGAYLVPDEYLWDMCMLARNNTFALRECSVIPMNSDQLYVPAELTLASVTWTTKDTGTLTAGEPTFAQVSLAATRLDGIATLSNELLNDSAMDVVSMLSEQFGYAVAYELDNQVLSGTGTPVSGLTTATCGYSVVMSATSTNFSALTADILSEAIYKLESGDTINARFIINRIGMHYARTLKDSNGAPIWAQPAGPQPATIWGFPYFQSEKITNTSAVSTALAVFGNFKKYYIGRRLAAGSLEVDPYGLFTTYQTRFRMVSRWALALGRSTAFVRVITAAA